jgi:DNA helicase-2/ATP-dependent DNA helicase PcrA
MNVSTFHSFCARFLRREAEAIGYDRSFTIFDAADSVTLAKNCIKELNLSGSQFTPKAQVRKISDAKNKLIDEAAFARNASGYFETSTAKIYSLYQRRLKQCNAMDFDDLLFNTVSLLRSNEEVREAYRERFKYIMVDEYQDTNHVQYLMLRSLVGAANNIAVVGDEDQSIYGWRGADIRNILEFEKDFPGAEIIKLQQNYRSTETILKAASGVIAHNIARKDKTLWTEQKGGERLRLLLVDSADQEANTVVDLIDDSQSDTPLKQTAILYRTNAQSRPFEEYLRRRSIPYHIVGGIGFYQRREIKDILAYLKLIVNPKDDVSFQRVINYPRRGIGDKSLQQLMALASAGSQAFLEVAARADEFPELHRAAKRLLAFADLIGRYRQKHDSDPVDLLTQELVEELNLLAELKREDEIVGQTRIENVEALIEGMADYARRHGDATLVEYLSEISLFTDLDEYREIDDKVTLMTIHSAKGLEYDSVLLVGLEEGLFPLERAAIDPMQLEEERRLFYVAATRARKRLILSAATARHRFGVVHSRPSRFIDEIPKELVDTYDSRTISYSSHSTVGAAPSLFGSSSPSVKPKRSTSNDVYYEYEEEEMFRPGRIVQHPTFGRGKIVNAEGFGESLRLDIMFTGMGLKKIMAKYARLKVVG